MTDQERLQKIKLYTKQENINYYDGNDVDGLKCKEEQADDTIKHILKHRESVRNKLNFLASELDKRAEKHDESKLMQPELNWLIQMDKEPRYQYGTPEYFDKMKKWQKFFKHHYAENRHHPDHFQNGIYDMNIVDICEYITDIISYYDEMHVDDALKTLETQKERFGFDEQLYQILKNTLFEYFTWVGGFAPSSAQKK
jgi:hypothetical protein